MKTYAFLPGPRAVIGIGLVLSCVTGVSARAQTTLSYWDFNVNPATYPSTSTAMRTALFTATGGVLSGTASMSTDFLVSNGVVTPGSSDASTVGGITFQTGTTVAQVSGDTSGAGQALQLQGGSSPTSAVVNNGAYLQFSSSTASYNSISVIFAVDQFYTTGFSSNQFQYSTDGTTWTNFGAAFTPPVAFADSGSTEDFNLSSVSGLNNDPNAAFRIVFNGAANASGADKIDNLQIISGGAGLPEPCSVSLLLTPAALAVASLLRPRCRLIMFQRRQTLA